MIVSVTANHIGNEQLYVYKTTNTITNKEYIGCKKGTVESTQDYYGSGKLLREEIARYGLKNFTKEILKTFDDYEEAKAYEANLLKKVDAATNFDYYNLHNNFNGGYNAKAYTKESTAKIGYANSIRVLSDHQRSCKWMNTPEVNAKKHPRATCIHCGITSNKSNIARWHNNNCKRLKVTTLA